MKKSSGKWKVILRRVLLVVFGAVLGVNVYMANARSLMGNQMPMPFGYGAAMVLSGSMEPTFSAGDLIVVKEQSENFAVDDIVVFQDGTTLIVHRIISIDGETVTTQGDANNAEDVPIEMSLIKGRVLFWIPYAGHVVSFLKTPVGIICVLAAAIALVEIPRRKEKERDDEDRQKIIDEIRRLKEDNEK